MHKEPKCDRISCKGQHVRTNSFLSIQQELSSLVCSPHRNLAFTRIRSLTSFCGRINHPFIVPAHAHYPHYCNTITRPLRNRRPFLDPAFECYTTAQYIAILGVALSCKKRNRSHTQTHDQNNTTQHTTRTRPQTTTRVNPNLVLRPIHACEPPRG